MGKPASSAPGVPSWLALLTAAGLCLGGFGLLALWLGQDANWDTRNYHRYNPYALLGGRLGLDLAPAQMQTYFNPLVDLPNHLLQQHFGPRTAGFLLGAFQGLNALLVFLIARAMLVAQGHRGCLLAALLALAGCLNASFVAQLGTSAGDSTTSVFVLLGLWLMCRWSARRFSAVAQPEQQLSPAPPAVAIGLALGLAVGLKLTNAPFALAMALALAAVPAAGRQKLRTLLQYGSGLLLAFALTAGWWLYAVWVQFGNPLFPQFNRWFGAPLATATAIVDTRWGPVNAIEGLAWPFWMSARPWRIHDTAMFNFMWLAAWCVLLWWAVWLCLRALRSGLRGTPSGLPQVLPPLRPALSLRPEGIALGLLLLFSVLSYLLWLKLFSIGRYMTPVEVLLPLLVFLLLNRLAGWRPAMMLAAVLVSASLVVGVAWSGFGLRAAWAPHSAQVDVPPIATPGSATLIVAAGDEPNSWLLLAFPPQLAVLRLGGNFARSPAYNQAVSERVAGRGGPVYVLAAAHHDWDDINLRRIQSEMEALSLPASGIACRMVGHALSLMRFYKRFELAPATAGNCRVRLRRDERLDVAALHTRNVELAAQAGAELAVLDYALQPGSCRVHAAAIGSLALPFQFCLAIKKRS